MLIPVSVLGQTAYPTVDGGPLPVAGAILHLDAGDPTQLVFTSGEVSQWSDKSGADNHATQASGAARAYPATNPNLLRGAACLGMQTNVSYVCGTADASDRTQTCFVVMHLGNGAGTPTLLGCSADGGRQVRLSAGGVIQVISSGTATLFGTTLTPAAGQTHVVAVKLDTASIEVRLDSEAPQSNGDATAFTAGRVTHLNWKGTPADPQYGTMMLAEVVVFPTALSSGDMDLMMSYARTKWAI